MADKKATAPEREIQAQIDTTPQDARATGITKVEQPATNEEIPDTAEVVREYAKWTDNDGQFHKVPIDGTTAIREPAHEQHETTIEDRDHVDQALALKTPRRDNSKANAALEANVHNDEVHESLAGEGVKPAAPKSELAREDEEAVSDTGTDGHPIAPRAHPSESKKTDARTGKALS